MKAPLGQSFYDEQARFSLRCTCEDCVYFDAEQERCTHGYPNAEHRRARLEQHRGLVFCKDFDLR